MASAPAPRRRFSRRNLILGLLAFCGICTVLSVIYSATPAGRESAARTAATSTARAMEREAEEAAREATREAEEEARSLAQAEEDTAATAAAEATRDAPTATPEPTATAEPTPDPVEAAEEDYRQFVVSSATEWGEAFQEFSALNGQLGEDPTVLRDDGWVLRVATQTVIIEDVAQRVIDRADVPESQAAYHTRLVEAARLYQSAMQDYRRGMDNVDAELLGASLDALNRGNEIITEIGAPP